MNDLLKFLNHLLGPDNTQTRWGSGHWGQVLGWSYIISDILTGTAFVALSLLIAFYTVKKGDRLPFKSIFWLFVAFIFACGIAYLFDILLFWHRVFGLKNIFNYVAAILSWITVIFVARNLPQAFSLPTNAELEEEVSRRRLMEEELKVKNTQLEETQRLAHMGNWRYNPATNELESSDELKRLAGLEQDKNPKVEEFLSLIHPDDRGRVIAEIRNPLFSNDPLHAIVYRIIRPDGRVLTLQTHVEITKNADGEVIWLRGTALDISLIKQAEEALAKKAHGLEQINVELETFAYAASHDMQEPLRKIRSFADRLKLKYQAELDETGREYIDKIMGASVRMQLLIDDLLTYARIMRDDEKTEKVNLNEIVKEVLSDLEIAIQEKKAHITINQLPDIEAIPAQMRQLFQNLFSNSLKFSRVDIAPQISVSSEKGGKNSWNIYVKDNGVGFDQKYAERIFIIFQRLHGKREFEGTGIGLAMVKKIVDFHNGSIKVQSAKDQGTMFTISLPERQR